MVLVDTHNTPVALSALRAHLLYRPQVRNIKRKHEM